MSRGNNNNTNYNGQYYGNNGQYNGRYYNQNGQPYNNQYYNQNGQYYNQNNQYYNQNQNNGKFGVGPGKDKKKKFKLDKKTLIYIIAFAVFAIALIVTIFIINNNGSDEPIELPDDVVSDTRVVGNEVFGYLTIPSDWISFDDKDSSGNTLQYSDKDQNYVITIDAVSTEVMDAKNYALAAVQSLEGDGTAVETAVVEFNEYAAYQVYGYNEARKVWVSAWFFDAEDGNSHFVGIEGPDKEGEFFQIPYTFKLEKIKSV